MTPNILQKSSKKTEKIQNWGRTWSDVDMKNTPGPQYGTPGPPFWTSQARKSLPNP